MRRARRRTFIAGVMLLAAPAALAAPPWQHGVPGSGGSPGGKPGGGPGGNSGAAHGGEHGQGPDFRPSGADQDRIHSYYAEEFRHGRCPPGLARKNNGCLPPGQAKAWVMGQALPAGVAYYPLPGALLAQIAVPPPGYQYVRVASDILLIATATGVIASAVADLAR